MNEIKHFKKITIQDDMAEDVRGMLMWYSYMSREASLTSHTNISINGISKNNYSLTYLHGSNFQEILLDAIWFLITKMKVICL
jgi:hypothetical protein